MNAIATAKEKIRGRKLKIVLPEGDDERVRSAAKILESENLAEALLFTGEIAKPTPAQIMAVRQQRPKLNDATAARLLARPLFLGCAMVAAGNAHAFLAGASNPTARIIEAAQMTIGLADGVSTPSSFFLMNWPDRALIFSDCALNIQPTSEELASIAIASAKSAARILVDTPRIAFISFSTHGSASHADVDKVAAAVSIARTSAGNFFFDGEFQVDAALSPDVAKRKVKLASEVAGRANVLVFPDLDAGNSAYKIAQYLGGAQAIGPILQGFAKPVSDLSRGATVEDIVSTAALLLSMAET